MSMTLVWKMPHMSQEFAEGPKIRQERLDQLVISYDYEQEDGSYAWEEMSFTGVVAFKFTLVGHCSLDQIDAFDELHEVTESEWAATTVRATPGLRHYRIYFDDIGCYEVLATTFVPPPEGPPRE
jgi:hypothetical protein